MKKTIDISLGGMLFHVEDDAYARLESYLASIRAHFGTYAEHDEIVADIEARIGEQLAEKKHAIITLADIDSVVAVMGRVEDFEGADAKSETPSETPAPKTNKRLFRDPDDKVIAGVASGVAAYFNVDPTFMRIAFVILALITGGTAIIVYLIMAVIVPEAKTPAEKLQMRGGPIDLKSFEREVKTQVEKIRTSGFWSDVRDFFANIFKACGSVIRWILKAFLTIIGVLAALWATFMFAFASFVLGNLLFNAKSPTIRFPLADILSRGEYHAVVLFGYALIIVPIVVLFLLALSALKRRWIINGAGLFAIFAVWLLLAAAAGVVAVRVGPTYAERLRGLPEYQKETREVAVGSFNAIDADGSARIRLVEQQTGSATNIVMTGHAIDLERLSVRVEDGVLKIDPTTESKPCLFCPQLDALEIEIRAPRIERLKLSGVARAEMETSATGTLAIELDDAARADVTSTNGDIKAVLEGVGRLTLKGSGRLLEATLKDAARLDAYAFTAAEARIMASDASRAEVHATQTIDAIASDAARIRYQGTAEVRQSATDAASVRPEEEPVEPIAPLAPMEPMPPAQ